MDRLVRYRCRRKQESLIFCWTWDDAIFCRKLGSRKWLCRMNEFVFGNVRKSVQFWGRVRISLVGRDCMFWMECEI